ncbi:MAG: circadian clock protein KaiC, partial [Rhodoferax sp.]
EEYVSDCVIVLDHRVSDQTSSRRLRVVKYRGSTHGTNEYPFLIDEDGFSVLPVTSLGLQHAVTTQRIPSGIARLDTMLGGQGFFRGSSVLVSGMAGTGKSSISAHFADAACRRGERALYFAFEESPSQIMRNMRSIGIDLEPWVQQGLLRFQATRPAFAGLEMQLTMMHKATVNFNPQVVIVDPLNGFIIGNNATEVKSMLTRLADFLKTKQISSMFTQLISGAAAQGTDDLAVSSMIDTWLMLRDIEIGGERNRGLCIIKSRGMAHSNQVRECLLTDHGVELCEVYVGAGGVLTGSARLAQEAQELASKLMRKQEIERRQIELAAARRALEAKIDALRAEFDVREAESMKVIEQEQAQAAQLLQERVEMGQSRSADR